MGLSFTADSVEFQRKEQADGEEGLSSSKRCFDEVWKSNSITDKNFHVQRHDTYRTS